MNDIRTTPVPAWLRAWSVLTLVAALPLVVLGAEVTTKSVGMVDAEGFRTPWDIIFVLMRERGMGWFIEHGHRLFGFLVGMCCIVLALGLTLQARGNFRYLGWLALGAVVCQGMLGIFRVNLHALFGPDLALVHGCFAQLVVGVLVGVAVICSRTWSTPQDPESHRAGWSALGLCLVVYLQIVFGALLRHKLDPLAQRIHVLLAFGVLVKVIWLWARLRGLDDRASARVATVLFVLVLLQPILGVEAWIRRFGTGELPDMVPSSLALDLSRTGHHLVGTLIFAGSVAMTTLLLRPVEVPQSAPAVTPAMEGA